MGAVRDFSIRDFAYFVAVALPLAGAVLAAIEFAEGDRDDALRISVAALLGFCLYALLFRVAGQCVVDRHERGRRRAPRSTRPPPVRRL